MTTGPEPRIKTDSGLPWAADAATGSPEASVTPAVLRRGRPIGRQRHDLMAQADPEERAAVGDDGPGERNRALEPGRVAGPGRKDQAVDLVGQRDIGRHRVGQDPDPGAAPAEPVDDVRLQPEVDDADQGAALLGAADIADRSRRDLADEVLILPARDGPRPSDRLVAVRGSGFRHGAPQRAVGAKMPRQRSRVDARD